MNLFLPLLIVLIFYLPSTNLVSSLAFIAFVPIVFFTKWYELKEFVIDVKRNPFGVKHLKTVWLICILLVLIFLNLIFGGASIGELIKSPVFLFPLTILSAFLIADTRVFKILLIFIGIEIVLAIFQYIMGFNSFFEYPGSYTFETYKSLYHTRVFGLADNSSYLAAKSLIGILILSFFRIPLKKSIAIGLYLLFTIGIILTFGRTVFIAFMLTLAISMILLVFHWRKKTKGNEISIFILASGLLIFFIATSKFWLFQFSRQGMIARKLIDDSKGADFLDSIGAGNLEMAGRKEYWSKAIDFIIENPWFGNHSQRFLVNGIHVHNSYLEFASTHGLVIFIIMIALIVLNLKKNTFVTLGIIGLYSIGQFGIFWNISFLDILFFSILFFGNQFIGEQRSVDIQ